MDFEDRAQRAEQREQLVRAALLLADGLQRHPQRESALESLLDLYVEELDSPGIESDLIAALAAREDTTEQVAALAERLDRAGADRRREAFIRAAESSGWHLPDAPTSSAPSSSATDAPSDAPSDPAIDGSPSSADSSETFDTADSERRESAAHPSSLDADSSPETERRSRRASTYSQTLFGLLVVLVVAGGGWYLLGHSGGLAFVDRRLRQFDTTRFEQFAPVVERRSRFGDHGRRLRERRWFAEALVALERGEVYRVDGAPSTSWGRGAVAMAALTRGDLERAVRAETALRRAPDARLLVRLWTSGRVAEYRGDLERALEYYRRGTKAFPEFVPFWTGRIRLALRRLDRARLQSAVDELENLSPDHPYVALRQFPFPDMLRIRRTGVADVPDALDLGRSRFGRVASGYLDALRALHEGDYRRAKTRAERTLEIDGDFAPALWVEATACAARFEPTCADERLRELVDFEALAPAYRWRLRVLGPRLLRTAGRADRAVRYVLPGTGGISVEPDAASSDGPTVQPLGARPPARGAGPVELLRQKARLERIRVLADLGRLRRGELLFERMPTFERLAFDAHLLGAELEIRSGRRPVSTRTLAADRGPTGPKLATAFYVGKYERAIELARTSRSRGRRHPRLTRYLALSHVSRGQGRRAMEVLVEAAPAPADVPAFRRLRARIRSRLTRGGDSAEALLEPPVDETISSTPYLIDATATAMWTPDLERADRASRLAHDQQPRHPGVHWFRGLVLRLEGRDRASDRHLRRSWRTDGADHRLELELGHLHLALGDYERARERFFHAVLVEHESMEAIRGLGRACLGLGHETGRWNFQQILESYEEGGVGDLYVAELLRWLAVFHGSREGRKEAKTYLDRARDRAGSRPLLLMETARWFEARDQLERAQRLYLEALEKNATLAEAHLGLARVADAQSDTSLVQTHLKRYLALQPASGPDVDWARRRLERLDDEEDGD